jgi:NAD(P)H-flavin reductase
MMKFSIEELLKLGVAEKNIYLSLERNMKCAIGFCGHCQYTSKFICKDGPVFNYSQVKDIFNLYEV